MREVDWAKYPDATKRGDQPSVRAQVGGDSEPATQDSAGAPDMSTEPAVGKIDRAEIDVREVVDVHGVIPGEPGEPFDFHTYGLEKFNHPEFQVLAPGYCRGAVANLLWNHAEQVINAGERFAAGETVDVDGVVCGYEIVPGDSDDDPPRLRIVDVPGGCKCDACEANMQIAGNHAAAERTTEGEPKLNAPESLNNAPGDASNNAAFSGRANRQAASDICWSEIHEFNISIEKFFNWLGGRSVASDDGVQIHGANFGALLMNFVTEMREFGIHEELAEKPQYWIFPIRGRTESSGEIVE